MRVLALLYTVLALSASCAEAQTADEIAQLFFPPMPRLQGVREQRTWSAVDADLEGTGSRSFVVVLYSNGLAARLRVIRRAASGPELVADVMSLGEESPTVELVDVDADGKPEILASSSGGRGPRHDEIFRWSTGKLESLTPNATLEEGGLVDIDGDGKLEFIEPADTFGEGIDTGYPDHSWRIYALRDGKFANAELGVPFFHPYERDAGKPVSIARSFAAQPGKYTLHLASGEEKTPIVDSAVVKLNGEVVASPGDFNGKDRLVQKPVTLKEQNTIEVELRSKPGSVLNVSITQPRRSWTSWSRL